MKDVAKKARVTTQTVSRALSGGSVHPETQRRILKIAEQLGYVKNSSASALRSGRAKVVAVLYDDPRNLFFPLITDFLQENLQREGYIILTMAVRKPRMDMETYNLSLSQNVSGIISYLEPTEEFDGAISGKNIPMLLLGRHTESVNFDSVEFDDFSGGVLAAERLIDHDGCKNVLYVTENLAISCLKRRLDGFESVLENKSDVRFGICEACDVIEKLDKLNLENSLPDGVFCFNDMTAMKVLNWYDSRKIPAPKVMGFDNISQEVLLPCQLTSVGSDKCELAKTAVGILIDRMRGNDGERIRKTIPVFLAEGTTA